MTETYPVDIRVRDLTNKLTGYLTEHDFVNISLESIHNLDKQYLEQRDARKHTHAIPLTPDAVWRSADDYLLFENHKGTLAYIRSNPHAPKIYHALPFEIHFRTAAPSGFSLTKYFSLALPKRNLQLLLKAIHQKGYSSISSIAGMDEINVLRRIHDQIDEIEGEILPVRIFHSTYVSRTRDVKGGYSDKGKSIEELSKAIGPIIIATHLFSRKQIAYYKAAAEIDNLFLESALVA